MSGLRLFAVLPAAALCAASILFALPGGTATSDAGTWPSLATAGPFLQQQIGNMAHGRYAAAWTMLYPEHQKIVSQTTYTACERSLPLPAKLQSARVLQVSQAPVRVAGLAKPVSGVAVTVRILIDVDGRDPLSFTHTFHLVPVRGHWTWLLSAERYELYTHGACGAGPAV